MAVVSKVGFCDLPPEIRRSIYALVSNDDPAIIFCLTDGEKPRGVPRHETRPNSPRRIYNLMRTCRLVYVETISILYAKVRACLIIRGQYQSPPEASHQIVISPRIDLCRILAIDLYISPRLPRTLESLLVVFDLGRTLHDLKITFSWAAEEFVHAARKARRHHGGTLQQELAIPLQAMIEFWPSIRVHNRISLRFPSNAPLGKWRKKIRRAEEERVKALDQTVARALP
ncbi:hypothetical protein KVT40_007792 [Elsinoe batatas]|uniref:Uncharacterized protein n=1 Tax=Elsinoe batatas TaxID=2601811 RepID=A0A8K0KWS9_9PEZI|nr:hypothetical protein KVT40_007792 [Elsinoe batatas]